MTLRRASGEASFAADFVKPGALHLAIRRAPLAHARVVGTDAADARSLPGVVAVITPDDAAGLLDPVLRYAGDRAAVVAAEDVELARRAASLIALELEPRVPVLDPERAAGDPEHVLARLELATDDADDALTDADQVVEGTWSLPYVPAVPLEPSVALTWLDEDRRLVVRTTAESPFRVRGLLAERLGLPAARIRVARPLVAGRSARRADVSLEDLCALVTLRTGRPARLALTAEEELTTAPGRPPQRVRVRLALREGRVHGTSLRLVVDLGAEHPLAEDLLRSAARQALGLYGLPHLRFEGVAVRTHRPPTCAAHGADHGVAFALECALNEAAAALGADPVAFRRRHLRDPGPAGETLAELGEAPGLLDPDPLDRLLGAGEREASRRRAHAVPVRGSRRGLGVGLARRSAGASDGAGAAASLRLLDDGSLTLAAAPSSAGGPDETAYAEAAAEILDVPVRRVVPVAADTDSAPFQSGDPAAAFFATGRAVEEAAALTRRTILEAGARLLDVPPSEATISGGAVRTPDGRSASYAAIGTAALRAGHPLVVTASPSAATAPSSHAAVFAEVEVDEETGIVRVVHLAAVLTGGPFADPRPAEGQAEGALASAVEYALAAGQTFEPDGRPKIRSLDHWPLVAAVDVPPLSVRFLPAGEPLSRFGAAAVGEAVGRAALSAIAGAVAKATGGRVDALPLTPARVLAALGDAERT